MSLLGCYTRKPLLFSSKALSSVESMVGYIITTVGEQLISMEKSETSYAPPKATTVNLNFNSLVAPSGYRPVLALSVKTLISSQVVIVA